MKFLSDISTKISYVALPGFANRILPHGYCTFCNWWYFSLFRSQQSSDLNLFRDFEHRFSCTSILLGFIFFFYPCFPFVLSLYLFLSHCIVYILVNYRKSFFRTQRRINKSINTSCVCKYGTLFFLRQIFTSISSVVLTQLCKEGWAGSVTLPLQTKNLRYIHG